MSELEINSSALPLSNRAVLIVEDDEYISRVYVRWLENSGAVPVNANNAQQALDALEREEIDIILLDLGLPGIGGIELLKMIKADPRFCDIPVLIISNSDMSAKEHYSEKEELAKLGVAGVLKKYQTSLDELVASITANLDVNAKK